MKIPYKLLKAEVRNKVNFLRGREIYWIGGPDDGRGMRRINLNFIY